MGAILSPWSPHLARKFLYIIAAIILLVLAAGVVYQLFPGWIARTAFVPSTEFKPQAAVAPNAYDDPEMWFARHGMEHDHSAWRSEEHTSELQSLMRISYAGFCLKKKTQQYNNESYM